MRLYKLEYDFKVWMVVLTFGLWVWQAEYVEIVVSFGLPVC